MKIQEYRSDLIDQFVNPYNSLDDSKNALEKILWLLYNPIGYCEECGLSWDSLSCSCLNCQYDELTNEDQIINEPCGNVCVCICDYFDGEPTQEQIISLLKKIKSNELTDLEKEILTIRKGIICDISIAILTSVFDTTSTFNLFQSEQKELSRYNDPFDLNKEILKYHNKKLSEDDRIRIINVIFLILEHYSNPNEKKIMFNKIFKFFERKYLLTRNKQHILSIKIFAQNLLKHPKYLDNDNITLLEEAVKGKIK